MTLNVYFVSDNQNGTANLIENLITNEVKLKIYKNLCSNEIEGLIDKALKKLKPRYSDINVKINWNTIIKEEDKDVITSK